MSQASLARAMGKNPNHLNHVMYARYSRPTALWADLVANALDLPEEARYRLHLAAAKDSGFKL
jgi:cyanate lyase